jgi:hypothetical protein
MGAWNNKDGLVIQYGPQKATASTAGDFLSYGDTREIEITITLANLTTTAILQDLNTYVPAGVGQVFIEKVVVDTEVGMTVGTATAYSVGLGYVDPTTVTYVTVGANTYPAATTISDTAIVNGALNATVTTAGQQTVYTTGVTGAGAYIGTASAITSQNNYITAKSVGGTYTGGVIKVRIFYRGLPPITQ